MTTTGSIGVFLSGNKEGLLFLKKKKQKDFYQFRPAAEP